MQSELALTTELHASSLRPLSAFTRSCKDQMAFILCQPSQHSAAAFIRSRRDGTPRGPKLLARSAGLVLTKFYMGFFKSNYRAPKNLCDGKILDPLKADRTQGSYQVTAIK
jgi:hypothetical protein